MILLPNMKFLTQLVRSQEQKNDFSLKILRNGKEKSEKAPITQKLGQNSKIEKIPPLEKNSKIMCAKYRSSNFKTVP